MHLGLIGLSMGLKASFRTVLFGASFNVKSDFLFTPRGACADIASGLAHLSKVKSMEGRCEKILVCLFLLFACWIILLVETKPGEGSWPHRGVRDLFRVRGTSAEQFEYVGEDRRSTQ